MTTYRAMGCRDEQPKNFKLVINVEVFFSSIRQKVSLLVSGNDYNTGFVSTCNI